MKIIATIEARMNSSRLPGKVMMEINNTPSLGYMINRVKKSSYIDEIVVATTTNQADYEIVKYVNSLEGVNCVRGSEEDVMSRIIKAGTQYGADIIVELTGDCPLIDPTIIDQAINFFLSNEVDYVSNVDIRSYPDGMDVQVFKLETLIDSYQRTKTSLEREHVTLNIRRDKQRYKRINMVAEISSTWPELGLTLDEKDDLIFIRKIVEKLGTANSEASCTEIIKLLRENKELLLINQAVRRKGDT